MSLQTSPQIIAHADDAAHVKRIWKAFWILLILTVIELALGLTIYQLDKGEPSEWLILFIKGVICILTLAKAFFIISIFMHLGDEIQSLVYSLALPAMLFIWFITAFLVEGTSFKHLRNTHAGSREYKEVKIRHKPLNIPENIKEAEAPSHIPGKD